MSTVIAFSVRYQMVGNINVNIQTTCHNNEGIHPNWAVCEIRVRMDNNVSYYC